MSDDSPRIVDLDDLVSPAKTVKLAGREYRVPGDMPLETYLRINRISQLEESDDADQGALLDEMVDLIASLLVSEIGEGDRDAERTALEEKIRKRGIKLVMTAVTTIYRVDDEEEVAAAEDDGVPPTETGTTTTSTSPPTPESAS